MKMWKTTINRENPPTLDPTPTHNLPTDIPVSIYHPFIYLTKCQDYGIPTVSAHASLYQLLCFSYNGLYDITKDA